MSLSIQEKRPVAPISWGDLIDKITILEIKRIRVGDAKARANVEHELDELQKIASVIRNPPARLDQLKAQLAAINGKIWDIEDNIRRKEARKEFDNAFIELARGVYQNNDERARVKREINTLLDSELVEEKSYVAY
jgi:peptidoglycan hydrolase CwlO-like protein